MSNNYISVKTAKMREQHAEIIKMSRKLLDMLDEAALSSDSSVILANLSELSALLRIHLVFEDTNLYPTLISCEDEIISSLAKKFQEEMGNIYDAFSIYRNKWTQSTIEASTSDFIKETKALFEVIFNRIKRENEELYKIADKLL